MKKMLTMKEGEKRAKETGRRKKLDKLGCRSSLLLSVVSCIALIHVELRIQEHRQLISESVTSCDHMEAKILQKLQAQGHKDSQVNRESHSEGHWQKARGIKWRQFLFLTSSSAGDSDILFLFSHYSMRWQEKFRTNLEEIGEILSSQNVTFLRYSKKKNSQKQLPNNLKNGNFCSILFTKILPS